ncbi:Helicase associated domain protein [Streptomyces sp. NPDC058268]|uniref:Helicase associated domain protein n=1 Tax=Streptomyces sp. NPDC058268 TaxID=3346413 RepID=UPI0036EFBEA6
MVGELWPHQVEAVDAVASTIGRGGRTSLIAACGTGKTRIGGALSNRLEGRRVLVVVPTIELLVQTLDAYRAVRGGHLGGAVAVCSDPTISEMQLLEGEPDVVVTTTAEVLADSTAGRRQVTVLSTYASLPVVAAAHANHGLVAWDLVVVDEAHRTTGKADGPWKIVHHDAQVPAERRLYMTATPRVATTSGDAVVSMDDRSIFGDVSYRLPFSRAIGMGLLADYRVIVPVVTDEEVHRLTADEGLALRLGAASLQPATVAGQIAVLRTMSEYGVRRAISYHHRVADARTWASTLPATASLMPGGPVDVWAGHVSGAQPPHLRRRVLRRLADPGDELAVVSNARVLNEGVDVPAVDAVVFSRPRRSAIDTIQAVGRALRTGGRTDKVATIVIPLLLAAGESPEAALESSEWDPVWQVLRALRDHDDRLDEELRLHRVEIGEGRPFEVLSREHKLPSWLTVAGIEVPDAFARSILIRAVRATTPSWDEFFGAARAYRQVHGNVDIPQTWITSEGLRLGDWFRRQRVAYSAGTLAEERAELLEELGIVWDQLEETWMITYEEVRRLAQEQGHFVFEEDSVTSHGVVVLNWCSAQRTRRRAGKVPEKRIALLDAIGFPWDGAQDRWMRRYNELKAIHERRGTLMRLPVASPEATWLEGQRAASRNGRLAAWQHELLAKVGIDYRDRRDIAWHNTYEELKAFHTEEGHWVVPEDLVSVDDVNVRLWSRGQRGKHKKGTLTKERFELLDKIGFPWAPAQERWDARCVELRKFHAAHGHINLPNGQLRWWLYQQRKKRREDALTQSAAERLAAVDPLWHDEQASLNSERTRRYFRLTDTSWEQVKQVLPKRGGAVWESSDHRAVIEAILWKLGTGARWDDLGTGAGSHVTVSSWYYQWEKDGLWQRVSRLAQVRGHQHEGFPSQRNRGAAPKASAGGAP